jgi:very-short-patch-repair endonuclease
LSAAAVRLFDMTHQLPEKCQLLLRRQCGVIASWQAEWAGLNPRQMEALVRYGRWQRSRLGVYAAFTGELSRRAELWSAVLRAGPQSILSHSTAAELYGLANAQRVIHVTVPQPRHLHPIPGIVVHRSSRFQEARDPGLLPPRTSVEETVLDLAEYMSPDDVVSLIARACQRPLTTPYLLAMSLETRAKMRGRGAITQVLADVGAGAASPLEQRYLRDVERAHRLPTGKRQARAVQSGRAIYRDVLYETYAAAVELDGRASHPDEQRLRDRRRDNAAAAHGIVTLRYSWTDVSERACETALEISLVLGGRGWRGTLRRCGPSCRLPRSV